MEILFAYGNVDVTLADGPFVVDFEDVNFEFLSAIPEDI